MEQFHAHLDVCRQCREHPFALCSTGGRLLRATAPATAPIVPPLLFSVVALVIRPGGDVLAISRLHDDNDLGLPGGKIETDETPDVALKRELWEEARIVVETMTPCFDHLDRVEGNERRPCRCFLVTAWKADEAAWAEIERTNRSPEGAWVGWVRPARLLEPSCSFHEYNRALFAEVLINQS
jgi:8-oxo-dGTP pyrophosphatase MutT (NUDIX family)